MLTKTYWLEILREQFHSFNAYKWPRVQVTILQNIGKFDVLIWSDFYSRITFEDIFYGKSCHEKLVKIRKASTDVAREYLFRLKYSFHPTRRQ